MRLYHGYRGGRMIDTTVLVYEFAGPRAELEPLLSQQNVRWWRAPTAATLLGPLDPRTDLHDHRAQGFEWTRGGGGLLQLTLAILADCFSDRFADRHYRAFRATLAPTLPRLGFLLPEWQLRQQVQQHLADHPQPPL